MSLCFLHSFRSVSVVSDGLHVNETSADHPIVRLLSGDEESDQSSRVNVSQRSSTSAHSLWEYLLQRSLSRSIVQKPISSSPDTKQNLASIAEESPENSQTKSRLESASSILQPSDHLHASSELTHPVEAEAASVSTEDSGDRLTPEKPVLDVSSLSLPQVSSSLAAVDGPAPNPSIDERTPTRSASDGSQSSELLDDVTMLEMTTADLPSHGSGQKESIFMRLNNRIKVLEMNMSLSGRYLEQLSQRSVSHVQCCCQC